MSKAQLLLLFVTLIPLANCCAIKIFENSQRWVNFFSKTFPILFSAALIGLLNVNGSAYLEPLKASQKISFGFSADKNAITLLFFLNIIWISFSFYSTKFLQLHQRDDEENSNNNLKLFFALIVSLITLIIISKNIITTLLFYYGLLFLRHFYAIKFLYKEKDPPSFFTFILYLESILFSLAVIGTYKFTGKIDFISGEIIAHDLSNLKQLILLSLYSGSLFLSILAPAYFLYRNVNTNPLKIYSLLFLAYAFSSLCIFIKLLVFVFGVSAFSTLLSKVGTSYFEWIFLISSIFASYLLLFCKDIRESLLYLLFHQFTFALFSIFTFVIYDKTKIYLPIFSFSLAFTLLFLCIANITLFLNKTNPDNIKGLSYDLKVTSGLLAFVILNLMGLVPGLGMVDKFFMIKILFQKELTISGILFALNFISLAIFIGKLSYKALLKPDNEKTQEELELVKIVDFDSNLILTPLVIAVIIFLSPIFIKLVNNFF